MLVPESSYIALVQAVAAVRATSNRTWVVLPAWTAAHCTSPATIT